MMEKWMVSAKKADFKDIAQKFNIDPVTARLIRNRNYISYEDIDNYLNGTIADLYTPRLMKDMEKGVDIIIEKIAQNKPIRIIGDYDIDGIMSTYILLRGLKIAGADVDENIPERIRDGYGLNESLVRKAFDDKKDTIITCDNGISASSQTALAKQLGMTVVITDHHEVPFDPETQNQIIPDADAVIDPKQNDCHYPFKDLCGASVAWKFIILLFEKCGINITEAFNMIEFAAIATIGDVCDLRGENRIIVKEGLDRLSYSSHKGLNALIKLNNIDANTLNTYQIGFIIGPCLNASGRLDTAQKALDLMTSKTDAEALNIASELINLNTSRKGMTEEYTDKAIKLVETTDLKSDKVLVVYLPECHESLAGIIAGRLRERFYKPSFVLTDSETEVKGSGRSIDEYSMFNEMTKCKELFIKYGGHPLAAGLSLKQENIPAFRKIINENCTLTDDDMLPKVHIDLQMPIGYITSGLIHDFEKLKPFGKGNSKPVFALKNIRILHPSVIGKNRNVVRMQAGDESGHFINAVYFGDAETFFEYVNTHELISIVYYPEINNYRGYETLQIIITNYM